MSTSIINSSIIVTAADRPHHSLGRTSVGEGGLSVSPVYPWHAGDWHHAC